jgi:hypothetical protein
LLEVLTDLTNLPKEGQEEKKCAKEHKPAPDAETLKELFNACSKYDIAAMDKAMSKLDSFIYDSQPELVEWLREQMENLEYKSIQERLEEVLKNE